MGAALNSASTGFPVVLALSRAASKSWLQSIISAMRCLHPDVCKGRTSCGASRALAKLEEDGLAKKTSRKQTQRSGTKKTSAAAKRRTAARTPTKKTSSKTGNRGTAKARKAKAPSTASTAAVMVRGALANAVTTVATKLPWTDAGEQDAIQLLESDHRRFEALLEQGEESTDAARQGRRDLLEALSVQLNAHELMEERVLYPALQSHPEARDIVLEGYEEHHVADLIVNELHLVATDDERWGAKFKVLKENIEHHIEEEEGEMFRLARGIFSKDELMELANRMRELRDRRRPPRGRGK